MSCYIINNKTASSIVTALIELDYIHETEAPAFLDMMMSLNSRSVNERYSENEPTVRYVFSKQKTDLYDEDGYKAYAAGLQMMANIAFYHYQSCETDICNQTIVMKILNKMKGELLTACKFWLIENGFNDGNGWKGKDYDNLPFSEKTTWGLYDHDKKVITGCEGGSYAN
ncbi:hypothetical protein [Arsenophonus nasoniae]|uniref:Uncharacterized protein n=1 Tax=Arsenophonus nasoniae TaxID=638 RepID=A0AA95GVM3_9GAMM|nr:hypothetical protein [Arsenophonus nasoniae]WGM03679.1 hypothetical protein QE210_19520 [Arsenophonus nasoniae]WGM08863.1 hypothetical protein QE258_26250 [Arsenophonus nasoniae]